MIETDMKFVTMTDGARHLIECYRCGACKKWYPKEGYYEGDFYFWLANVATAPLDCKNCRDAMTVSARTIRRRRNPDTEHYRYIRRRYGIEPSVYEAQLAVQEGRCFICREEPDAAKKENYLKIDMDTETNTIRCLLCFNCMTLTNHLRYGADLRGVEYIQAIVTFSLGTPKRQGEIIATVV